MNHVELSAFQVARYFLGTFDEESGDNISNLKLQKLLYYAQGFHVAMHAGTPLFPEPIVAWDHGPVVEPIYHQFKHYRWQGIDRPKDFEIEDYSPEIRELLGAVYGVYGQYTAKGLENKTHNEPPWRDTPRNSEISLDSLKEFFTTLVDAGRIGQPVGEEPLWPSGSFVFQQRRAISDRMARHRNKLRALVRQAHNSSGTGSTDQMG